MFKWSISDYECGSVAVNEQVLFAGGTHYAIYAADIVCRNGVWNAVWCGRACSALTYSKEDAVDFSSDGACEFETRELAQAWCETELTAALTAVSLTL